MKRGFAQGALGFIVFAASSVWAAAVVYAAPPVTPSAALPNELHWSDVLHLIHERSPRLRAIQSQSRVADTAVGVAGVRPNPSINYTGFGRLGRGDNYGTQHQIGFEQPLWLAGQRSARVRSAEREAQAVRAEGTLAEAELDRAALHAFVRLLAAQAKLDQLNQSRSDVAAVAHTVHERVNAGAQSNYDASRVDLESAQLDTRLAQGNADVIDASTSLAEVLGFPGYRPRAVGELAPMDVSADADQLWQHAQRSQPSLIAAERHVESARGGIEVARAERWGEFTLSGGALLTSDKSSTSAFLGIAAPLPIFNFGGAALDHAQAALAQAETERDATRAEAQASLIHALDVLNAQRTALSGYDTAVIQRLPALRDMAETAYKSGTASLLELLDSVRSGIDVRLQRVDLASAVMDAEVDVMIAAGLLQPS